MANNKDIKLLTSKELERIEIDYLHEGGYNTKTVDELIDRIVETLRYYERATARLDKVQNDLSRLTEENSKLKQEVGQQAVQIQEMSDNGYDRVAFMNKIRNVETSVHMIKTAISQLTKVEKISLETNQIIKSFLYGQK
ncbi:hypothetical protein [Mycoplasma sp. E35C]|uniref:hypothetical protein n=1 Tax=Mycoplasma sp. E35C TaxID=2801918 RepID=UPI001CA3AEAA|nr:hypothetical protein [Mycoplasma sp. E35C]QZX48850.1 hypothetical protein JJE79_02195 [Mycoplasma sp. E35C]